MFIQGNWRTNEGTPPYSSYSDDSNGSSQFQQPGKQPVCRASSTANMHNRPAINRQMAVSTLAALHRRFGLPVPVATHARTSADFRASANKALDILRQTIQAAVTKEIDEVIKKYFQKFFVPAVNNIRTNLGEESVNEDQVRAVCRSMLDATRTLYAVPPRTTSSPIPEASDYESSNGADYRFGRLTGTSKRNSMYSKRKESDTESETDSLWKRKKVKLEVMSEETGPSHSKWDPQRLTHDTLFIMGSHAHKVLGLGTSRGRLYTKHAGLLRYPADPADKEWIASNNLMNPVGGRTYIMVMEDIKELAASEQYRKNALPLDEHGGFRAPPFMLCKMKAFLEKMNLTDHFDLLTTPKTENFSMITEIKSEVAESPNSNLTQYEEIKSEDNLVECERIDHVKYEIQSPICNKNQYDDLIKTEVLEINDTCKNRQAKAELDVEKKDQQRRYNFDFLDNWLPSMASEAGARNAIRHVTGANPDTISLANEEFDLGFSILVPPFSRPATPNSKCITVESSAGGPVHSVPVARLQGNMVYTGPQTSSDLQSVCAPVQSVAGLLQSVCRPVKSVAIPMTSSGSFVKTTGAVQKVDVNGLVQNTCGPVHGSSRHVQLQPLLHSAHLSGTPYNTKAVPISGSMILGSEGTSAQSQSLPCAPHKQFSTGNLLHNNTVSRNMLNRSMNLVQSVGKAFQSANASFSVTLDTGTIPRMTTTSANASIDNVVSTTKEIVATACKSSAMLKKVLTLGRAGADAYLVKGGSACVSSESTATSMGSGIISTHILTLPSSNTGTMIRSFASVTRDTTVDVTSDNTKSLVSARRESCTVSPSSSARTVPKAPGYTSCESDSRGRDVLHGVPASVGESPVGCSTKSLPCGPGPSGECPVQVSPDKSTPSMLSATHATLSALLASSKASLNNQRNKH